MKLVDYIKSDGIPLSENIYLIYNEHFPGPMHRCFNWNAFDRLSPIARFSQSLTWRFPFSLELHEKIWVREAPKMNSILFFGRQDRSLDDISSLKYVFSKMSKLRGNGQYSILLGKGDYDFTQDLINSIPFNINKLFINNLNIEDERLSYFPMGRDFRSRHLFGKNRPQVKEIFLYCNFSINTHPVRKVLFEAVKQKKFITIDHMGDFLKYELSREEFYKKLASSKFALCPRGNAIDTFRLWDCLYLGTIPIVVKEAVFHEQLSDLPILFVDSLKEIKSFTRSDLEDKYKKMLYTDWNYEKLKLSYWMSRLKRTI